MSILLVTYDLNQEGANYNATRRAVMDFIELHDFVRVSESAYAVETDSAPREVYDLLEPHLDADDDFVVFSLRPPFYGQLADDAAAAWLDAKVIPVATRRHRSF